MARRRRAFFRTPYSPSRTGVLPTPYRSSQARRKPSKYFGKPSKGNRKRGKRNPERYQRKTLPRIGPFQWVTTIRRKNQLLPASPGAAPRGGRSATGPLYPWFLIIARKSRALMALSVGRPVCCSFVEPLPSWPGLSRPSTPGRRKNEFRLGATGRKADGRKAFRACLRRCAGLRGWPGQAHGCPVHVEHQFSESCGELRGGDFCGCFRRVKFFRCMRFVRTS